MTKFYSQTTGGLYPEDMRGTYTAAGTWPDDAVAVSSGDAMILRAAMDRGDTIGEDKNGRWIITPRPPIPYAQIATTYLNTVRTVRDQILNRIAGIGFAATATGDTATVKGVMIARQALLDITIAPSVLAATDADGLKAAVLATYRAIVAAAPVGIRAAFNAEGL